MALGVLMKIINKLNQKNPQAPLSKLFQLEVKICMSFAQEMT